jgi:hypothetical protein
MLSASFAGRSLATTLNVVPASLYTPRFYLLGDPTEVASQANGATVTPQIAPGDFSGKQTIYGSGKVEFAPSVLGLGVGFLLGGQQNTNTAFYAFAGQPVGHIFNQAGGEVSFYLTSSYSFAQRAALPQPNARMVFDVYDNSAERFYFAVRAAPSALVLGYMTGSLTAQEYVVPGGTEDALFGKGQTVNVRLAWNGDGGTNYLYLNGKLVQTHSYIPKSGDWTNLSSFSIGATDVHNVGGGTFSCDDILSGFLVRGEPGSQ